MFQKIARNIISNVHEKDLVYYSKSLYGIELSKQILVWVNENINELEEYSTDEILDVFFDLYMLLFPDVNRIQADDLREMLELWLLGRPYIDICDKFENKYTIGQVEKACGKIFSYQFCFFIGNVIDAIGERAEELVDRIMIMQKEVKYGVPSTFQMLVCDNIFDDRIIAEVLEDAIGGASFTAKQFKQYMKSKQEEVLEILEEYPAYFIHRFYVYLK